MSGATDSAVAVAKRRADRAWTDRSAWDALYTECYDYAIPNRRPARKGRSKRLGMKIYDMTAPTSVMHGASTLVRQLIPPGQEPFTIEAGPLLASRLPESDVMQLNRDLAGAARQVHPFFKAGDFDAAMHTTAIDLFVGTGAIMPMKGPSIEEPVLFVNIPIDEIALQCDVFGRVFFVSWRTEASYEEIKRSWPNGRFSDAFNAKAKNNPSQTVELYQDFERRPDGYWRFVAYSSTDCQQFIVSAVTRARPIATPRFYRGPGETLGRGPLLMALPTIKTANKAQEIALKSAAIQMVGIWAFRSGGTFNPDTVRVGPGEFWPLQSTGGVLGPDVTRLDPPNARFDIARMVIGNQRDQIREALLDTRIVDDGGTPASASEIAARVQQASQAHIGAYGSLVREIMPVLVPRTIEILNEWGIVQLPLPLNELVYSVEVVSPMTQALKADQLMAAVQYVELTSQLFATPGLDAIARRDKLREITRHALQVNPDLVPTEQEVEAAAQAQAGEQLAQIAGEAAVRAAPQMVAAANQNGAAA